MASIINEVIKETIKEANSKKLVLTPENYQMIFCEIAKKRGITVEECKKLEKYISKLEFGYQAEAKKLNVNSMDQLFAFMNSRLNRASLNDNAKLLQTFVLLSKRILQVISVLHNKEARNIANISLQTIDSKISVENIELIKDKWFNFLSNYDDDFLDRLSLYGIKKTDSLETIINVLLKEKLNPKENEDCSDIANLIVAAMTPSIASSMNDELADVSNELKDKPELIQSSAMQDDIKKLILKRVKLDKTELKYKISSLNNILNSIDEKINSIMSLSAQSQNNVNEIKNDINNVKISDDYLVAKEKLLYIADSIDVEISELITKMEENEKANDELKKQIKELENKLMQSNKEVNVDFLTNVGNRRAFDIELANIEEAYQKYGVEYAICFFDIDYFKQVNDSYGHEAGDIILATVGRILKKNIKNIDFIGRYGGEEFVAILPKTDLDGAIEFGNKIVNGIKNYKFMYRSDTINITISCGVALRSHSKDEKNTLENADVMLYKAKKSGRNCVQAIKA